MTINSVYDIAIVGAGQSGMACAYELHKLGVGNFIVIEARDRVGGRTVTQDLGDGTSNATASRFRCATEFAHCERVFNLERCYAAPGQY
jgi:cation diffusion facilitator CzcD-associated flavoprotein CzcO